MLPLLVQLLEVDESIIQGNASFCIIQKHHGLLGPLKPKPRDIVVAPHKTSCAFVSTELDLQLRQHGIERIVLAGMLANTCVELTGRYAVKLGYDVTFLKDAVGATSWEAQRAAIEVNYPRYASAILTVDEFLESLSEKSES